MFAFVKLSNGCTFLVDDKCELRTDISRSSVVFVIMVGLGPRCRRYRTRLEHARWTALIVKWSQIVEFIKASDFMSFFTVMPVTKVST
jgi:hypothetical protein